MGPTVSRRRGLLAAAPAFALPVTALPVTALLATVFLATAWAAPLPAHNPLLTAGEVVSHWPRDGEPVAFVIHEAGLAAVTDASDELAIRRAVRQWEVPGAQLDLIEDHRADQRARTDYWTADGLPNDIHLLISDEASDFFPPGSSVIAVTPVWTQGGGPLAGTIVDADILYNAGEFAFSTDLAPGTMDLEAITTHEIGHLVGFGHSGLQGSTMVPTADFNTHFPRNLTADDANGVAATYAGGVAGASVRGGIIHLHDGSPVRFVSVWAREELTGRVLAQGSTGSDGTYELLGLPPGRYELSMTPYDGPISVSSVLPPSLQAQADVDVGTATLGLIDVPKKGLVVMPPALLPVLAAGTPRLKFPARSVVLQPGQSVAFTPILSYSGDVPADAATTLGFHAPRAGKWFDVSYDGSAVGVVAAWDTPPGFYDLVATNAYGMDVYPGLLEIVPPPPVLDAVSPRALGPGIADELTLTGSGFHPALAVHVGDRPATFIQLVDSATLRVGVPALAAGTWDVTIIDERSGLETRLAGALDVPTRVTAPRLVQRRKLRGRLTGLAETDTVSIEGLPEALLSVAVKGDTQDGLRTRLVLRAPSGEALLSTDSTHPQYDPAFGVQKGGSSRIQRFPLPELGTYALEITALGGTTGLWTAAQRQKVPVALRRIRLSKSAPAALAPGAPAVLEILGASQARVSGKLTSKDGATPVLETLQILGIDFADTEDVVEAVTISGNGRSIRFRNLTLPAFGLAEMQLATNGAAGTLTGKLVVKPPKGAGVQVVDI